MPSHREDRNLKIRNLPVLALACLISLVGASRPAMAADSKTAARLNNTGVALMNQQLMEKALAQFDAAHRADPASAVPVVNRGLALLYSQKVTEAEAALKQAVAMDPKNVHAWYGLGLTFVSAGNPAEAIGAFRHVLELAPNDADSYYYLGSQYQSLKDYPRAIANFETALRLQPLHASAQFGLASALQRSGRTPEAREHLKRFQTITQAKIATPFAATYGEQGGNGSVLDMLAAPGTVGPMIPVSFIAAAQTQPSDSKMHGLSGGACILRRTKEEEDIAVMAQGEAAILLYRLHSDGSLALVPASETGLNASGHAVACAVGDFDNDGHADMAVAFNDRIVLYRNGRDGRFSDVTKGAGLSPHSQPAGVTFIDFDHDGDLDLFVTGSSGNALWRNNGDSTFTEWTAPTGLGGSGASTAAMLSDINNDRAIDLAVTGAGASPTLYENQREGAFKTVPLYSETGLASTRGLYIFDFDKDGWMDVAVTHSGAPGISLWRNVEGKRFERMPLPAQDAVSAWGVTAIDVDNDGWIDLAAVIETEKGTQLRIWRNRGAQGFEDVSQAAGLQKLTLPHPRALLAKDVDDDGALDLIVTQQDGPPIILHNRGGNKNHSLRISLTGLADNKSATGTKVEVFSDGHVQKFEVAGASGYLSQSGSEIIAGLGKAETADVVRMLWPSGVPQDELDASASKPLMLMELDRRGSSCPVLFAWDGSHYQFISDVIGAAVVGHWISPTATNHADADEWIKIDGAQLKARNGLLSLRFGEPMEEINYIDQLRLVAIDHPVGTEVYPDERFLDDAPFATGAPVLASPATHALAGAWDDGGRDVLPLLAERDHKYVRDFTNLQYAGYAKMHTLTLDLGRWSPHNPLHLFLHGFIEYFSASSMYAAWQAGLKPISPYMEAQMPDGSWKKVIGDMGFPAGLPRTIFVDLTDKLPPGTQRIRISTNLQIYWDQVLEDNAPAQPRYMKQTELHLSTAHLAFRGYPQQVDGETPGDLTYRYDQISATGPFQWQRGSYTRYGDVTPLLHEADDRYVVFGSGEEIDAEFSNAALPALPAGWKRDYFFYANGFVKDMDFYEALPFTVAQLPFHKMSRYPYPESEHYPDDTQAVGFQLDWNSRYESGEKLQWFRFDYEPVESAPIQAQ